ncbi:hypothetical protein AN958_00176, partial [Leucoagaricus sp. SymC.cos]
FVHNSKTHANCQQMPHKLILGVTPPSIPTILETPSVDSSKERLRILDHTQNEAITSHKLAAEQIAHQITSTFKPFKQCQKVWLEATNLHLSYPSLKIAPKQQGPFTVKQVISPLVYKLNLPQTWKIHPVFHASLLTPYNENDIHSPNLPLPPPDMIEGEEQYKVEGIVNHCLHSEGLQYLVKWKGYRHQENKWIHEEELTQFANELIQEYLTSHAVQQIPHSMHKKGRQCLT